jgi:hypothetical protein
MGINDIGAVKDTTDVTIYHPVYGDPMLNADKSEMTVTIYGPYSDKYKTAERAQQNRRFQRAQRAGRGMNLTAEQLEAETFNLLLTCIEKWNITLDTKPEPFSPERAREVLTEHPWIREQLSAAFSDTAAFLEKPKPT